MVRNTYFHRYLESSIRCIMPKLRLEANCRSKSAAAAKPTVSQHYTPQKKILALWGCNLIVKGDGSGGRQMPLQP
jgi:hypothetical protein